MIISSKYAQRLILQGKASYAGTVKTDDPDWIYVVLNRHDLTRTDHTLVREA